MYCGLGQSVPYAPPWEVAREVRYRWFRSSERRIAYVYDREDTFTFRYRAFNMVQALLARPEHGVSAAWFTREDYSRDQSFVDEAEAVIVCRARYDDGLGRLAERARRRGIPVVFDVDDLLFDTAYVHFVVDALDEPKTEETWDRWFAYIARLSATLDLCDGALVTTEPLRQRIAARSPGLPCAVLPNFLNEVQARVSAKLVATKRETGYARRGPLTIGYLSGSPTHDRDLAVASPAIADAMRRHQDLRLRIVGFMHLDERLTPFSDRIDQLPFQDFSNLQRVTAECELCIAPLRLTTFSQCKSELKFFEAGAVQCPIIASPSWAFGRAIVDGENGFLARASEWDDKLAEVLSLADGDASGLRAVSLAACESSLARYAWDAQAPVILAAIDGVTAGRQAGVTRRP